MTLPAMSPQQPRLLAFWCYWCGQQVVEDHPVGWNFDYCSSCSWKIERESQATAWVPPLALDQRVPAVGLR